MLDATEPTKKGVWTLSPKVAVQKQGPYTFGAIVNFFQAMLIKQKCIFQIVNLVMFDNPYT